MQEGDVVAGRWRLVGEAPGEGAVRRFRAVATDTGEPAEVLALRSSASADDRRAFLRVHRILLEAQDPALVDTLEVVDGPGEPAVVRAPLEDGTLDRARGPLPASIVAAVGARLVPAVLAAGPATGGALLPSDVGLDERGRAVLAPRGRPLGRIDRAVTRAVAPESFSGAPADGSGGLYGLGALLYRLATGREVPAPGTRAERAPPPPPSTLHHGVPPELDQALLRLLSSEPAERVTALPLLLELAGDPGDLRQALGSATGSVRTTVQGTGGGRGREVAAPVAGAVLPATALERLDPAGRSAAAGWADLPLSVVDALAEAGLPLVVEPAAGPSAARRRTAELTRESGLPLVAVGGRSFTPLVIATATAAVVGLFLAIGAVLLAVGLGPVSVVFFVLAGLAGVAGGWGWGRTSAGNALLGQTRRALRQTDALRAGLDPAGRLTPTWRNLARVRRALAGAELPAAASADLRGALKDVERRLQGMAEVATTAGRALAGLDAERLRTRLAALERRAATDPEARGERDRLARALVDLEEVEARQRLLGDEARRIDAVLEEIHTVLARASSAGADADDAALAQLVRTTAAVRDTAASVEALDSDAARRVAQLAERAASARREEP